MDKVTYIDHSSFVLELDDRAFLFDYWKGDIPPTDKPLYIFSSHRHRDHFNEYIMNMPARKIILSNDIRVKPTENTLKIGTNKSVDIDGMKVTTLKSTDEGVAFIIEYKGKIIYHAGDLNDWYWEGEDEKENLRMRESYRHIIKKGFENIPKVDIAFLLVDPRQENECGCGTDFFLENVEAKHIFPMHFWGDHKRVEEYIRTRKENIYTITHTQQVFELEGLI